MIRNVTLRLGLLGAALLLAGCQSLTGKNCNDPRPYQEAKSVAPLKLPAGFDNTINTRSAMRIPELTEPEPPPRGKNDACIEEPPRYSNVDLKAPTGVAPVAPRPGEGGKGRTGRPPPGQGPPHP